MPGGVQYSITIEEDWVAELDGSAEEVRFTHGALVGDDVRVFIDGVEATESAFRTCGALSVRRPGDDEDLFALGAPRIWDAADHEAGFAQTGCGDHIEWEVSRVNGGLAISLIVGTHYLTSAERTFPVVVDPLLSWAVYFNGSQDVFGSLANQPVYSDTKINREHARWGNRDSWRGFYEWPINGVPNNAYTLIAARIIYIYGHYNGGWNYSMASNVNMRWYNWHQDGAFRPANYGGNGYTDPMWNTFFTPYPTPNDRRRPVPDAERLLPLRPGRRSGAEPRYVEYGLHRRRLHRWDDRQRDRGQRYPRLGDVRRHPERHGQRDVLQHLQHNRCLRRR